MHGFVPGDPIVTHCAADCIESWQMAADWRHFMQMDLSRASDSLCFGIVLHAQASYFVHFARWFASNSDHVQYLVILLSKTDNDFAILVEVL